MTDRRPRKSPSMTALLAGFRRQNADQKTLFFEDDPTQDVEMRAASAPAVETSPQPPRVHAREPLPTPTPFHVRIHPFAGKNLGLAERLPTLDAVETHVKKISRWLIKDETIFVEDSDGTVLCLWYKEGKKWVRESHMLEEGVEAEASHDQQATGSDVGNGR